MIYVIRVMTIPENYTYIGIGNTTYSMSPYGYVCESILGVRHDVYCTCVDTYISLNYSMKNSISCRFRNEMDKRAANIV